MTSEQLEILLSFVGPLIQKQCVVRESIDEKQRLVMCIRFLATGELVKCISPRQRSIEFVQFYSHALYQRETIRITLQGQFLTFPKSTAEWQGKAVAFQQSWDYPHSMGAIDSKHVEVEPPANSRSLFCNYMYEHSLSMVLFAVVDFDYKFTHVDIGAYGKQSDGGIFSALSSVKPCHPEITH
ncbi:PiggyBac transposable element-derived protein 4-like [Plakobranchus ocellatus]|uniref:PiggyBac transposable element-derived protein 4-like n=1 Tax=Plakobranchus ocellatus TaxID=259542 RepID=A0AAV4E0I2_9GAST|nr:PiggyBac transposable element-derived protein 4-like [Plakobranchus ocellatus]